MGEEKRKTVGILVAVYIASIAAGLIRPSLALLMKLGLGASVIAVSSMTSGFMAGRASLSLVAGLLGDLSPEKRRLFTLLPMLTAAVVVYAATVLGSAYGIILAMVFWGAMAGLTWPTAQTLITDVAKGRPGTVLSLYFATGTLGVATGNFLFGVLPYSYRAIAEAGVLLLALSSLLLWISSAGIEVRVKRRMKLGEIKSRLDRRVMWILYSAFTAGFMTGLLREYFYVYVYQEYHLSKSNLGGLLAVASLAALVLGLAVGPLSDRVGIPKTLLATMGLGVIATFLLGLDHLYTITATGYILALASGRAVLPLTRNAGLLGVGRGGSTMVGLANTVSNLGNMTSPLVAGALYSSSVEIMGITGDSLTYIIACIMLLLSLIMYVAIFQVKRETVNS